MDTLIKREPELSADPYLCSCNESHKAEQERPYEGHILLGRSNFQKLLDNSEEKKQGPAKSVLGLGWKL